MRKNSSADLRGLPYQIGYHRHANPPRVDHRRRIRPRNSADRHQGLAGQFPRSADPFEAHYRIRLVFAGGREYRANGEIVRRSMIRVAQLLWIVSGNPQPAIRPDDPAHRLRRQIVLANMDTVEIGRQAKVSTVIHDQPDRGSKLLFSSLACSSMSARAVVLVAVLHQCTTRAEPILC